MGHTANDPADTDTGANGLRSKPALSSAKSTSTKTTLMGKRITATVTGSEGTSEFSAPRKVVAS